MVSKKSQIGFFLSLIISAILFLFMIIYLLYVSKNEPASLYGVASIQLEGLEYKSSNGYLNSLMYYDGIKVPVIDLYGGYYNNENLRDYIMNQTINDTIYYLNYSSTILYFNFFGNQTGICYNGYLVSYHIYLDGKSILYQTCPPTTLSIYYYNITCLDLQ
ncbi:hypothetical protein YN1_3910 [Nanoarchaeota archaeon]